MVPSTGKNLAYMQVKTKLPPLKKTAYIIPGANILKLKKTIDYKPCIQIKL